MDIHSLLAGAGFQEFSTVQFIPNSQRKKVTVVVVAGITQLSSFPSVCQLLCQSQWYPLFLVISKNTQIHPAHCHPRLQENFMTLTYIHYVILHVNHSSHLCFRLIFRFLVNNRLIIRPLVNIIGTHLHPKLAVDIDIKQQHNNILS